MSDCTMAMDRPGASAVLAILPVCFLIALVYFEVTAPVAYTAPILSGRTLIGDQPVHGWPDARIPALEALFALSTLGCVMLRFREPSHLRIRNCVAAACLAFSLFSLCLPFIVTYAGNTAGYSAILDSLSGWAMNVLTATHSVGGTTTGCRRKP